MKKLLTLLLALSFLLSLAACSNADDEVVKTEEELLLEAIEATKAITNYTIDEDVHGSFSGPGGNGTVYMDSWTNVYEGVAYGEVDTDIFNATQMTILGYFEYEDDKIHSFIDFETLNTGYSYTEEDNDELFLGTTTNLDDLVIKSFTTEGDEITFIVELNADAVIEDYKFAHYVLGGVEIDPEDDYVFEATVIIEDGLVTYIGFDLASYLTLFYQGSYEVEITTYLIEYTYYNFNEVEEIIIPDAIYNLK